MEVTAVMIVHHHLSLLQAVPDVEQTPDTFTYKVEEQIWINIERKQATITSVSGVLLQRGLGHHLNADDHVGDRARA